MSAVEQMLYAVEVALKGVDGVRVYRDLAAVIDPPGLVVGPPTLQWGGMDADPTEARLIVAVVVAADERALGRLFDLLPAVAAAIDGVPDAVVRSAEPGSWPTAGSDLPAYLIEVECSL